MCNSKMTKREYKFNKSTQNEFEFINLPTEISQVWLDESSRQFSNYIIKERRIKKLIRLSAFLPIVGIFICDKYQHRWFVMNKSFVYFASLASFIISLTLVVYLIIFVL